MKSFLYLTSAFSAGFFCWAVFAVNTAFGAKPHGDGHGDGHHEASSSGLPQLDATTFPSQLFWLAVTFVLLYLIFSKKSLPEISGVLENRQQHIEDDLESAEKLKEEAEQAQRAYEESLTDAKEQATKALHDVQEKMKAKAEKQNNDFRAKAEKDIQGLEDRLNKAKEAAMDDMNTIAAEIASEAAKKIVGIDPDLEQAKTVVKAIKAA